jgi:ElaA protein
VAITWQWASFEALSTRDLYELLALRERVFLVEQNIICIDADGKDYKCWHLNAWEGTDPSTRKLVAHLRVLPPGLKYEEAAIGRVVVDQSARGTGLGRTLMEEGIRRVETLAARSPSPIRISAQAHLEKFYMSLGFKTVRGPYIEDSIPHIEMLRNQAHF